VPAKRATLWFKLDILLSARAARGTTRAAPVVPVATHSLVEQLLLGARAIGERLTRGGVQTPTAASTRFASIGKLGNHREQINALGGWTYLTDLLYGLHFFADTGAAVSVLPHSPSPSSASGPALTGADGKGIASRVVVSKLLCFSFSFPGLAFHPGRRRQTHFGCRYFCSSQPTG
jgi:hypothetical protein